MRRQLPDEASRFDLIDKQFKKIMSDTVKRTLVLDSCRQPNRFQSLKALFLELERCQKSLTDYLETKRHIFPRFFFLSDEELLSILGSHDPKCVQEHVVKMFDNVLRLSFTVNDKSVSGLCSCDGEMFAFKVCFHFPLPYSVLVLFSFRALIHLIPFSYSLHFLLFIEFRIS